MAIEPCDLTYARGRGSHGAGPGISVAQRTSSKDDESAPHAITTNTNLKGWTEFADKAVTTMMNVLEIERTAVDQAQAGNCAAFEALIGPHHHKFYRRAFKMTQNEEDAKDVVQDAELKAYCRLRQFQGGSRFNTWVMRIVINEALMKLRKRRCNRETEYLEPILSGQKHLDFLQAKRPYEQPDRYYTGVELRGILEKALAGLSPPLSSTFMLCYHEGYSPREVAAMQGTSISAIKSRLLRARRKLHRCLKVSLQPAGSALLVRARLESLAPESLT